MPAPVKKLSKAGFGPRQAAGLHTNLTTVSLRDLQRRYGFSPLQAKVLKSGSLTLAKLIRQGKFTRTQAQLILAST